MDPHGWCAPHLADGVYVTADSLVNGTSMCAAHTAAAAVPATSTGSTGVTLGGVTIRL